MQRGGDLSADSGLRAAYAAHGRELYRFALRGLGDPGLAQDAVQETFLRAWQSAHRYDPALASLRVWLFAIARNVMIDLHRRRTKGSFAPVATDGAAAEEELRPAADPTEQVLDRTLVVQALGRLSPEHREVIVETYLRGRSYDELATTSGVAAGTLRSRAFYALKALRVAMEEMGVSL
ncbi:RNA polymerase sigma-70 factor, ECF subfamily [Friedmanniella luteola]|uniref:RNA polymerase sigma-70 factor, ECF subfamily n=1 Tax=Friedmanniella luteola TaxID=546871 RepID=A0A1H1MKJ0_9ACTN|nr:sigma-70 family RNA polymerase sigma factor [Friedmanniella luteola]SDR87303.1 RNA polymerase sigma-70 factor, ECF subfamily [Friedmanniella luteola]